MVGIPLSRHTVDAFALSSETIRPLWTVDDFENEEKVLKWLRNSLDVCERFYAGYFSLQLQNLLIYQGHHWLHQDKYNNRFLDNARLVINRKSPRLVFNHTYDFVEHHVSKSTRYKPAVAIFPANREQEDADDAKISKDVLDYIWYLNTVDLHLQQWVRYAKIFGEAFFFIDYDFSKGDIHPDWLALKQQGQRAPVLDQFGQPILGQEGEPLYIQKCVRTGEVTYRVPAPWHVFEMPCSNREEIEWCIEWDCVDVDYLRAKYPLKANDIKPDSSVNVFNEYSMEYGKLASQVVRYKLYQRHTEFLEKGRYIAFTRDTILEQSDLPYSHGKLPYVKIHDIDVPDCIRGMSFIQQIFPINHQINAVGSLIYKALVLLAHPKIAMPDGATEIQNLLNESTVFSYQGGVPPTIMHMNPVTGELFTYMNKLEEVLQKLGGYFEISRGNAPDGVRAAKALRVLEEQEDKRSYNFVTKFNQLGMIENAKMTLSVAGDFYDDSDGRLARVVGKDNEYRIKQFKAANLSKPYDIRIENTTALSQSASARFEEINEMMQVRFDPSAPLSREQYYNLLDLGALDQFKDIVTRAIRCAQSENDDILSGVQVKPPTEDEDFIAHWKIHLQAVQSRDFKEITKTERQAAIKRHIYLTEYLMFKKAFGITDTMGQPLVLGNQAFAQQLSIECPLFPVYFKLPVPQPMGQSLPPGPDIGMPPGEVPPSTMQPGPIDPGAPLDGGMPVAPPPMEGPPPL